MEDKKLEKNTPAELGDKALENVSGDVVGREIPSVNDGTIDSAILNDENVIIVPIA